MNTNNNGYTIIYTTVIVIVVAAVLAVVSQTLKPNQLANEKADVISQMMTAAGLGEKAEFEAMGNDKVLALYSESIDVAYTVNAAGQPVDTLLTAPADQIQIYTPSQLKAIYKLAKDGGVPEKLPVFKFKNGLTVIPVYGAGLWGPIWGYLSFDGTTFKGAFFDHESETAGLGAKIKDDPAFQHSFIDKEVLLSEEAAQFEIAKAGAHKLPESNGIDAIAGATMTSGGLNNAINLWLGLYKPIFEGAPAGCQHEHKACGHHEGCEGQHEGCEGHDCEGQHADCDMPCCQENPKAEEE